MERGALVLGFRSLLDVLLSIVWKVLEGLECAYSLCTEFASRHRECFRCVLITMLKVSNRVIDFNYDK